MVLSTGGAVAAAVLSGAQAASAATPHAPSWHPVLSVPGGGVTEAVAATGKTTVWAFGEANGGEGVFHFNGHR